MDMKTLKFLTCAIGFVLAPSLAFAQTNFIDNDELKIDLPNAFVTTDCSPELSAKAGDACLRLGKDGQNGVIFFRQADGYHITTPEQLDEHVHQSIEALSDVPNVQIRDAKRLADAPLIATIDLVRSDQAVADITGLAQPPISQTSLIIPTHGKLAQLFVYLPANDADAQHIVQDLLKQAPHLVTLKKPLVPSATPTSNANPDTVGIIPSGSLSLLPRALLWGGAGALLIILILHLAARKRQKQREQDETSQDETPHKTN